MISQKTVQEIFETAKIEEVVQDFVSLKRRGVNMIGLCPFHSEKTPSFTVSPSKNIYKCFGCGQGGNAVQFIMEHEGFSFPEALRWLAKKYGIEIEEIETSQKAQEEQQLFDSLYLINQYARDFYQDQLFNTDRGKSIGLSYFKQRGFREEVIRKFGLGYAPAQGDAFTQKAVGDAYDIELLRKLGLTSKYDRDFFRDRVMFTIHNLSGKVIGFGGRILQKNVKAPKYINSPETEIYNKSKVLYGAYFAKRGIRQADECILVEGYTDVISLYQAGIENVVASSGTSLTVEQILLIKRYTPNIKIIYDGDPAGIKAALRGLDLVLEQGMNVKVVLLPDKEDPDSYLQRVGATAFQEYIDQHAQDFILFKAEVLLKEAGNDPVKKAGVIKDIVGSIAKIPDPIIRGLFVRECARVVGVEESLLVQETNKLVTQAFKKKRDSAGPPAVDTGFPTEEGMPTGEGPALQPEQNKPAVIGDAFQEKDIVRILVAGGNAYFDQKDKITIAEYVLANIADVADQFQNPLYRKITALSQELLADGEEVNTAYFLHHPDPEVSRLAVDLVSSPYEYSENWEKRWDIFLQTQKRPENNFPKDGEQALKRFKLRKIMRMCEDNQRLIQEAAKEGNEAKMMTHLKVQQKLLEMRNALAKELGTVVL